MLQYSSGGFSKTHPSQWGRIFSPPQPHPMFRASPHRGKDFSRRHSTATPPRVNIFTCMTAVGDKTAGVWRQNDWQL